MCYFEKDIIKLILHDKNQAELQNEPSETGSEKDNQLMEKGQEPTSTPDHNTTVTKDESVMSLDDEKKLLKDLIRQTKGVSLDTTTAEKETSAEK